MTSMDYKKGVYTKVLLVVFIIALILIFSNKLSLKGFKLYNIGQLSQERLGHQVIKIPNQDRFLFVGGSNGVSNNYLSSADLYNYQTKEVENVINTNLPHALPNLYIDSNNNIILIDNNGIELYDKTNKKFVLIEKNPFGIDNYLNESQNIEISNNIVLITGGKINQEKAYKNNKKGTEITKNSYLYDLDKKKIIKKMYLNIPRSNHRMININNYGVYIFGGISDNIDHGLIIEKFNPNSNNFEIIGKLKESRTDFIIDYYKDLVFLIGGLAKSNIEIYNLKNNTSIIKKNFIIDNNIKVTNKDIFILNIDNNFITFIYKNRLKSLSGIYIYDLNNEQIKKVSQLPIGNYTNITPINKEILLISGGEQQKQFIFLGNKICIKGKICTFLPANKSIKILKRKD